MPGRIAQAGVGRAFQGDAGAGAGCGDVVDPPAGLRFFLGRGEGHRALDGLHGVFHVQPAAIERLSLDLGPGDDLAQTQANDAQG